MEEHAGLQLDQRIGVLDVRGQLLAVFRASRLNGSVRGTAGSPVRSIDSAASWATVGARNSSARLNGMPAAWAWATSWIADRIAAQGEIVVVDADLACAQHAGEDLGQPLFAGVARGRVGPRRRAGRQVDGGQPAAVDLAVGRDGQRVEHRKRRGDHRRRQPPGQRRPHGE